jgi:hypothetical protein
MLYNYLGEYIPIAIIGIAGIFAFIKVVFIRIAGLRHNTSQIFVESFGIYSEQSIKNTFHKHLQSYYKHSNRINKLFYLLITSMLALYIFINML